MGLIFDVAFIIIILLTIVFSARRGFVRTLLELVGFVAAISIALSVSEPISIFVYDKFIEPSIIEKTGDIIVENVSEIPENLWQNLPGAIKDNSHFFGINEESFLQTISSKIEGGTTNVALMISQDIVKPAVVSFISSIICFILILVLIPVFRFVAKIINKLFSFSLIGKVNKILGGILGAVKGVAVCFAVCIVLVFLLKITGEGFWIITPEVLNQSFVFSKILPLIS